MKQLDNFIHEKLKISETSFMLEKLKITSNTKINNDLLNRIISLLPITEIFPKTSLDKVTKEINNWINGNLPHNKKRIDNVIPIAYPTDIDKFKKQGGSKEAIEEYSYNNSIENCEMCEDENKHTYPLYSSNIFEIRYNESILVFISRSGFILNFILYLYNEKRFY